MDSRSFVGIDEFVQEKISGAVDGRIGPAHVANLFQTAAAETQDVVAGIRSLTGRAMDEWRLMRTDILAASYLGGYYAPRILGTMYLDHALCVNNRGDYELSLKYLSRSRLAWGQLSRVCDSVYAPIDDPLLEQSKYRWSSQISRLRELDATTGATWASKASLSGGEPLVLNAYEQGTEFNVTVSDVIQSADANGSITITCKPTPATNVKMVTLWFKEVASSARWATSAMTAGADGSFAGSIPKAGGGYLCLLEITNTENCAVQFPSVLQKTPYWVFRQERNAGTSN
jgi:hypothetical protein